MFDLGYKQVVINSDSVVTGTGGAGDPIIIEGFGKFLTTDLLSGGEKWAVAAIPPAVGKYDVAVPAGAALAGAVYNVQVYFSGAPRILSELFSGGGSNYEDAGEIMTFQSSRLGAVDTLGIHMAGSAAGVTPVIPGAIIDGFNDSIVKFTDDGRNFKIELVEGYEGI